MCERISDKVKEFYNAGFRLPNPVLAKVWRLADVDTDGMLDSVIINPRNPYRSARLSTIDLLVRVACFVTKVNNIFIIKDDLN
jgi:hypothetical protein